MVASGGDIFSRLQTNVGIVRLELIHHVPEDGGDLVVEQTSLGEEKSTGVQAGDHGSPLVLLEQRWGQQRQWQ